MSSGAPKLGTSIIQGDVIEVLKNYPDESFTAVFTDPPYGLSKQPNMEEVLRHWLAGDDYEVSGGGFMGKIWDSFVPGPQYWREIYRVLKPGAVLLAFCGTRTEDLLGIAIRLAGFERFETCAWIHAQGFPKSQDISKVIDKMGGGNPSWFIDYCLEVADKKGISKKKLTSLFLSKTGKPTGWLYNKSSHSQNLTLEQYNKLRDFLNLPFPTLEEAKREILGYKRAGLGSGDTFAFTDNNSMANPVIPITAPATDAAKIWDGYGTNLKPSIEFILCFRKPRIATYAQTAMEHGSSALNIDGCRIASAKPYTINTWDDGAKPFGDGAGHPFTGRQQSGRWPANLLFSHLPECDDKCCIKNCPVAMLNEQAGIRKSGKMKQHIEGGTFNVYGKQYPRDVETIGDSGPASRFFKTFEGERFCYCSKANKRERNMGLPKGERNPHTTVKPLALCKYLATLIIPPEEYRDEAKLLVPFCGSGSEILGALLAGWRNVVGIDLIPEYVEIARLRIDWWLAKIKETGLTDPKAILKKGV